ncbi:MAG: aminoacyl-tRNA hydrolase, partial [Acidobacteriota bacterium]|nr:aminoacyl-tRNA hydrolase [Acidobacteriota bacterium]
GNPGEPYRATRYNVGFLVVEELARRFRVELDGLECNALVARAFPAARAAAATPAGPETPAAPSVSSPLPDPPPSADIREGEETFLALPQTYMNRSGYAARCLLERHGLLPASILVVYDEVNLPLGRLRLRKSGSPAGHRGLESIIENLRTDQVPRLRLGVGGPEGPPPGEALVDFVLSPFAPDEAGQVEAMVRRAADACECWLADGADLAMNRWNG